MLQRSFKRCGINIKDNGSENALVHIEGISEYVMPEADKKFQQATDAEETDWEQYELS